VGDPLYRPFAASLDEQIQRLVADHRPDVEWAYLRKVNLLMARGDSTNAEELCRGRAENLHSAVLYEKLGDLSHAAHHEADAIKAYGMADEKPTDPYRHIRVATKMATAYEAGFQPARALAVYERLATAYPSNHNVLAFYKHARDLAETVGDRAKVKSFQAKIDELTAAEQKQAGQQEKK
jgi:tetratricopeptide (TPR) repeat protein